MTAPTFAPAISELRRCLRPSREQLRVAAAMIAAAPEEVTAVVVPVVLVDLGVELAAEYPGGYWLADRGSRSGVHGYPAARDAAEVAAETHLRGRAGGVPGWVSIRTDGTWVAFDGAE